MNIKPKERRAILQGEYPSLVRPERPEAGEEVVLKATKVRRGETIPEVSLRVLSSRKNKKGGWAIEYLVKDDRGLYAAQGIGYTRSPARALDKTAPILDPDTIESYTQEAQQSSALLQAEHWRQQKNETLEAKAGRGKQAELAAGRAKKRMEA